MNNDFLRELFRTIYSNSNNSFLNTLSQQSNLTSLYNQIINLSDEERMQIIQENASSLIDDFISPSSSYTEDDYDLAEDHINVLKDRFYEETDFKDNESYDYSLSEEVKNAVLDLYYEVQAFEFPTVEQLVDYLFTKRCACVRNYPNNTVKKVIKQCLLYKGHLPSCELYPQYIEYYILHGRIPNDDELEEFIRRIIEFTRSPDEFHQKDKCFVPALHVDKLPIEKYVKEEEDKACCICQEDFIQGQDMITLLPCRHQFHNKGDECLEGGSILNWLEKYNFCPLCKVKVSVE